MCFRKMAKARELHGRNGCSIIREEEEKGEDYDDNDEEGKDEKELLNKPKNLIC